MQPPKLARILPEAFLPYAQFILWKYIPSRSVPGQFEKVPCDRHGAVINAHDPAQWLTGEQALHCQHHGAYGIGFVFTARDPFWFIDLDKCWQGAGWAPHVAEISALFPGCSYEVSASGVGLHLFGSGLAPAHKKAVTLPGGFKVEFYTEGRFVALTGLSAGGDARGDYSAHLRSFVTSHGFAMEAGAGVGALAGYDTGHPDCTAPANDEELLALIQHSRGSVGAAFGDKVHPWDLFIGNADVIARVMPQAGRADGCPFDRTRAESALMCHLAFYTGGHRSRMLRLFARSALYRPGNHTEASGYRLTRILDHAQGSVRNFYNVPPKVATNGSAPMLSPGPKKDFNQLYTLNGVKVMHLPKAKCLVEELIYPGVFLLVGKPKTGKSWLCFDLGLAVATGGHFLGRKCEAAGVIYFALEENLRRVQDRMFKLMPRNMVDGSDRLRFATVADDIQPIHRGFIDSLEYSLSLNPDLRLIIIDTFAMVRPPKTSNDTFYDYDRKGIDPLIRLCGRWPGLTIMLVHHSKKADEFDQQDNASGTTGLTGAVDGSFILGKDKENGHDTLYGRTRDMGEINIPLKFNMPKWEVFDPNAEGEDNLKEEKKRIVDLLKQGPKRMIDIINATDYPKPNVQKWLFQLVRDGYIAKDDGLYIYRDKL